MQCIIYVDSIMNRINHNISETIYGSLLHAPTSELLYVASHPITSPSAISHESPFLHQPNPPNKMYAHYCPKNLCHSIPLGIDPSPRPVDYCVILIWYPQTLFPLQPPIWPLMPRLWEAAHPFRLYFWLSQFVHVQMTTLLLRVRLINIISTRLHQWRTTTACVTNFLEIYNGLNV